jgi:hypothetical protein
MINNSNNNSDISNSSNSSNNSDNINPVAIDGATREILSGEMSLEERIRFGYKYAKNHPRYSENFQQQRRNPFKLGKPVRKYSSSSSDSESSLESESSSVDSDGVDAVRVKNKNKNNKLTSRPKTRRIRTFLDDEPKIKKRDELSDKQKVLLKEICNISTIDKQLDGIGISRNDFSESNVMLILSVIDSIVSSNLLSKEENLKIKKLLDEIKEN